VASVDDAPRSGDRAFFGDALLATSHDAGWQHRQFEIRS
jgi:hypothetical protein